MIKISLTADIPDHATLEQFLRYVRAFDLTFPGCHFKITSTGGDQSVDEAKRMLENVGLPIVYAGRKQ